MYIRLSHEIPSRTFCERNAPSELRRAKWLSRERVFRWCRAVRPRSRWWYCYKQTSSSYKPVCECMCMHLAVNAHVPGASELTNGHVASGNFGMNFFLMRINWSFIHLLYIFFMVLITVTLKFKYKNLARIKSILNRKWSRILYFVDYFGEEFCLHSSCVCIL